MLTILLTFTQVESTASIYEIASRLTHPISLAAFAIAVILGILTLKKKVHAGVWFLIGLLVLGPIVISAYVEITKHRSDGEAIYRVRVTVTEPQGTPTDDARVWSSIGGEPKKVAGGWQFDIPRATKPKDGKLAIYAAQPNKFLVGEQQLQLGDDLNPTITISLRPENQAQVRGNVTDKRSRAIPGALVSVVGYASEAVVTEAGGNFVLPAHAAKDQQVLLHAEKSGYAAVEQWHPAGDFPAVIVLERR